MDTPDCWHPGDLLPCDEINAVVGPGCLVRVCATKWGVPCGRSMELSDSYRIKIPDAADVTPEHLPVGVVVARCSEPRKGRHTACVLLNRDNDLLWFKISDLIVLSKP